MFSSREPIILQLWLPGIMGMASRPPETSWKNKYIRITLWTSSWIARSRIFRFRPRAILWSTPRRQAWNTGYSTFFGSCLMAESKSLWITWISSSLLLYRHGGWGMNLNYKKALRFILFFNLRDYLTTFLYSCMRNWRH